MSSHHVSPVAVLFCLALAGCSPAKPAGPQAAGVSSRAFVGDAELEVRYRYQPQVGKEIVLYVDTTARRGAAGAVRLALRLDGFTVVRGEPEWETTVAPSGSETHQVVLLAVERTPRVTITTHHVERKVELATDEIRFWLDDDGMVAECQPTVEACK